MNIRASAIPRPQARARADIVRREIRYDLLPEKWRGEARAYIEHGKQVDPFLLAILSNDLLGAAGWSDADDLSVLRAWTDWLWLDIPEDAWGNRRKVAAWIAKGGTHGRKP